MIFWKKMLSFTKCRTFVHSLQKTLKHKFTDFWILCETAKPNFRFSFWPLFQDCWSENSTILSNMSIKVLFFLLNKSKANFYDQDQSVTHRIRHQASKSQTHNSTLLERDTLLLYDQFSTKKLNSHLRSKTRTSNF
jgi:hypothetical protein